MMIEAPPSADLSDGRSIRRVFRAKLENRLPMPFNSLGELSRMVQNFGVFEHSENFVVEAPEN